MPKLLRNLGCLLLAISPSILNHKCLQGLYYPKITPTLHRNTALNEDYYSDRMASELRRHLAGVLCPLMCRYAVLRSKASMRRNNNPHSERPSPQSILSHLPLILQISKLSILRQPSKFNRSCRPTSLFCHDNLCHTFLF